MSDCYVCDGTGYEEFDDINGESDKEECDTCNGTGELCDLCSEPDCYEECEDDMDVDDWDDDIDDDFGSSSDYTY